MEYNYHTHTYLCKHAKGDVEDYVKAAIDAGFKGLGFSDHGPLLKNWIRMSEDDFNNHYLKEIERCKKKYKNIKIFSGLEIEYYPEYNKLYEKYLTKLDYLILGQHQLSINEYGVFKQLPFEALEIYKNDCIKAMESGYFKIWAHPDVILFRNQLWNNQVEAIFEELILSAIKNDVYLEVNCNGIRNNSVVQTPYGESYAFPRLEFWQLVKKHPEAKVIIGVDAHDPKHLSSQSINDAIEFCNRLGLNVHKKITF